MKPEKKNEPYDLSREASNRGNEASARISREQESDAVNEGLHRGRVPSPEGDQWAENEVATSLDDE